MDAEENERGYTWENEYERTWEVITEDEQGSLRTTLDDMIHQQKRRHHRVVVDSVRLGMMRHVYLIIDMSEAMSERDLKPSRIECVVKHLQMFVEEYFDQNPIGQLGMIITMKKRAERLSDLGGNPRRHVEVLEQLKERTCEGEPSLQNALQMALGNLRHMPAHGSREVIVLVGCLTSCDPGDISETIKALQEHKVRCSVVSLSAEVFLHKRVCRATGGQFNVILDESHLKSLLQEHVRPSKASDETESSLIKMGFPHSSAEENERRSKTVLRCMCHEGPNAGRPGSCTYQCPQCCAVYCELPVECKICGLTLVSAPHLSRSYHHLFPLPAFEEQETSETLECSGCLAEIGSGKHAYICRKCKSHFCVDCDIFLHDTLHSCPSCS